MSLCDRTALIVAERHSGSACVTAAVDSLTFLAAAGIGDTLVIKSAVNRTWRTSMEVGVRVTAENSRTGATRHIVSAYLTFVALDDNGEPTPVAAVRPESADEKQRYCGAESRRQQRIAERARRS